jgi:DNA-binding NarL/FixJ family response regulator
MSLDTAHRRSFDARPTDRGHGRSLERGSLTSSAGTQAARNSANTVVEVLVGCFDEIVLRGLVGILRDDHRLAVEVSEVNPLNLSRGTARECPAVVFLDEEDEYVDAARLLSLRPAIALVVLAREPTPTYGMLLLAAGITCLSLRTSATAVLRAVHLAAGGGCSFVSSDEETVERPDRRKGRILSGREIQTLELVSEGRSPAEIALEWKISVETVRRHITHLRRKLKVPSKRDLIGIQIPPALKHL